VKHIAPSLSNRKLLSPAIGCCDVSNQKAFGLILKLNLARDRRKIAEAKCKAAVEMNRTLWCELKKNQCDCDPAPVFSKDVLLHLLCVLLSGSCCFTEERKNAETLFELGGAPPRRTDYPATDLGLCSEVFRLGLFKKAVDE